MNPKQIESRNCKTPNCPNEATVTRGRYAYLCDHCRSEAVRRNLAEAPPRPAETPPPSKAATSFEGKAKHLVAVGKRLDKALAAYSPAKHELAEAMRVWKDSLRQLAGEEA